MGNVYVISVIHNSWERVPLNWRVKLHGKLVGPGKSERVLFGIGPRKLQEALQLLQFKLRPPPSSGA